MSSGFSFLPNNTKLRMYQIHSVSVMMYMHCTSCTYNTSTGPLLSLPLPIRQILSKCLFAFNLFLQILTFKVLLIGTQVLLFTSTCTSHLLPIICRLLQAQQQSQLSQGKVLTPKPTLNSSCRYFPLPGGHTPCAGQQLFLIQKRQQSSTKKVDDILLSVLML